ncbi:hypothetical protein AS9A_2215 [Hoyosella subflava DQS3-9A1]|uniref:Uncharacterized protein n=1 Tax=Hoyosella subflava (strain DSM 45089 / JCM 17490 / NBRC 109087 / DQS3-9A1) TaxID=443218 RepID=F6EQH9_HOYSD|nr:hypothetical protein AS9A_2215 [Hoyosella subflava DQS3-9A1]
MVLSVVPPLADVGGVTVGGVRGGGAVAAGPWRLISRRCRVFAARMPGWLARFTGFVAQVYCVVSQRL